MYGVKGDKSPVLLRKKTYIGEARSNWAIPLVLQGIDRSIVDAQKEISPVDSCGNT